MTAAIEAFQTRSYSEVTISEIAEAAGMAKGNLYRYFDSKEELLTAAIESLLDETTGRFASALDSLGGIDGLREDPDKAALVFGYLVADVLPMLLELGARRQRARTECRSRTQGSCAPWPKRPDGLSPPDPVDSDQAIQAGLRVINTAFATVMSWAVGPDWPPDHVGRTKPRPSARPDPNLRSA